MSAMTSGRDRDSDRYRLDLGRSGEHVIPKMEIGFGRFIGRSPAVTRLYPLLRKLAAADVPLVIEGETGTGKEALAEAIHDAGGRAGRPMVVFDCTAVPASLLEAALFGHERGAFTGADTARPGIFEEADGGTLLIDEIGDLDLGLQSRLLRVIQKGEVRRIGGNRWVKVDVRIIAATRRNLDEEVLAGRFRDDLFFRLAVARVELPALRERPKTSNRSRARSGRARRATAFPFRSPRSSGSRSTRGPATCGSSRTR